MHWQTIPSREEYFAVGESIFHQSSIEEDRVVKMSSIVNCERSVSPQCPKPNEPGHPEGTAVEQSGSGRESPVMEVSEVVGDLITPEMLEEEKQLMKEGQEKEKEMMEQSRAAWERDSHEMRFKRLQHLLEKSTVYSKFLLMKMEQQQLEEKKRKEKMEKKRELLLVKQEKQTQGTTNQDENKPADKKKRGREDYMISDIMTKEEIMSKAKKSKIKHEASPSSSQELGLGALEKNGDSHSEIKNRLSQSVRQNAQHLFDPERKVDGQPVPYQQPKNFTGGVMRLYQIEGMEWLRMLWENGINGILADEMGLGKTVQCIATISMMVEKGVTGPFLVVGPLSTLPNWVSEFKRFTPEIPVLLYHGPQQERRNLIKSIRKRQGSLHVNPVVITSFEIAMRDRRSLQHCYWKYLIVDEGHRIKNMNCRLIQELKQFNSDNKLLLTGTPLQNNLAELWSLLNFLLPDVFDDLKSFESWFDITSVTTDAENIIAKEREQNVLHMLHQILTPFLLRRLKCDVTLEVPPKREVVVYAPLTKKQETFYTAIVNKTIEKMLGMGPDTKSVELTDSGRPKRRSKGPVNYNELAGESPLALERYLAKLQKEADEQPSRPLVDVHVSVDAEINLKLQNVLMLLKRCCNHPYLIEYPLDPATQNFKIDEQLVQSSGKFLILDRMLPELQKRGHKVLIFSQMTSILDVLIDYCYLREFKYSRLDGSMSYTEREENLVDPLRSIVGLGLTLQLFLTDKFKGGKSGLKESTGCLDLQELKELLKSRDHEREVKGTGKNVISDKELETLLDRSDLLDQMKNMKKEQDDRLFKVIENTNESADFHLA
ncbi:UNVERIFIED_CONTAM: hypothetical protein FKN15_066371 [Acipenser sinensis]